jgi:hypothetical protein
MNNVFPEDRDVTAILCEGIREEKGGKVTLNGFYPGRRVVVPVGTKDAVLPLCLLFVVDGPGEGTFKSSVTVFAPSGAAALPETQFPDHVKIKTAPNVVVVQMMPFKSAEKGKFIASLKLDDRAYETTFQIEEGVIRTD